MNGKPSTLSKAGSRVLGGNYKHIVPTNYEDR